MPHSHLSRNISACRYIVSISSHNFILRLFQRLDVDEHHIRCSKALILLRRLDKLQKISCIYPTTDAIIRQITFLVRSFNLVGKQSQNILHVKFFTTGGASKLHTSDQPPPILFATKCTLNCKHTSSIWPPTN